MGVVALQMVKNYRDHVRFFCHQLISGDEIIVVSGNVFCLFDEFSECPVEKLGLLSFADFLFFVSALRSELGPFYILV